MLSYTIRRLVLAFPTLIVISFIIFMLLDMAPGDPTAQLPLTIPPEVRQQIRESLGLGEPVHVRYLLWLKQFLVIEPLYGFEALTGLDVLEDRASRVISWQTRAPVMDLVIQRLPQTLLVVGLAYVVGVLIAVPIGVISAYRQYSAFDQAGTFISMIGFSVPPFFTGVLAIVIFSVQLGWLPSIYDTTLEVVDWETFKRQLAQMVMPVMVLALQTTAQISRFMRASMLDNLNQDYVRTARAKGLGEREVVLTHVLRNSMIPVVTVVALGVPAIFGGAIITEQVFKVNGIGQLLITAIQANDLPLVQTLTFIFAVLIVLFNLIADILYGLLDPRIRMTDRPDDHLPVAAEVETGGPVAADILVERAPEAPPRSQWADVWAQFRSHKGALFGAGFFIFVILAVTVGPLIWTVDPTYIDIRARNTGPSWAHPFGADQLGRDMLARMLAGGQVSIAVGITAMLLALCLGTTMGVLAGFFRSLDGPLMRLTDLFLALPLLPLLLVMVMLFRETLASSFGPEMGIFVLIVGAIGLTSWMPTARIVRGDVLALKEREFVLAARSIGTTNGRLIGRHILPNVLSPIMVSATLGIATAIITESALSFLGLGFPPDFPTWGRLLYDATDYMQQYPERVLWPGLAISLTVLSVNYIGDGLRDALDPRIRGR